MGAPPNDRTMQSYEFQIRGQVRGFVLHKPAGEGRLCYAARKSRRKIPPFKEWKNKGDHLALVRDQCKRMRRSYRAGRRPDEGGYGHRAIRMRSYSDQCKGFHPNKRRGRKFSRPVCGPQAVLNLQRLAGRSFGLAGVSHEREAIPSRVCYTEGRRSIFQIDDGHDGKRCAVAKNWRKATAHVDATIWKPFGGPADRHSVFTRAARRTERKVLPGRPC